MIDIELCCAYCFFEKLHEGHKVLSINDEEELKKENIKIDESSKHFDDKIQKLNNLKNKIENEMIEIDKRYEKVDNEVTKSYEIKLEKLKKEEEDLKEKLKTEVTKITWMRIRNRPLRVPVPKASPEKMKVGTLSFKN